MLIEKTLRIVLDFNFTGVSIMSVPFMFVDGNLTVMLKGKAHQVLPDAVGNEPSEPWIVGAGQPVR